MQSAGIDFLAADGHKWLLGPEGAGILYVRKEHLELLRPLGVGWNSSIHAGDFTRPEMELKPTAERYDEEIPTVESFGQWWWLSGP